MRDGWPSVSRFEVVVPISVVLIGVCSCRCSQRRLRWCWQLWLLLSSSLARWQLQQQLLSYLSSLLAALAAATAVVVLLVGSGSSSVSVVRK